MGRLIIPDWEFLFSPAEPLKPIADATEPYL